MSQNFDHIIDSTFKIRQNEGESKVVSLSEAVSQNVKPGMQLYLSLQSSAFIRQIIKQFAGTSPQFTVIMNAAGGYTPSLVHYGLIKKLITSSCAFYYPAPAPVPNVQKAYAEKKLEIENWTSMVISQRLMAAAQGVSFMPTRSIIGSDMARENKDSFIVMDDPFGSGQKMGLVKALAPDVAMLHGCMADPYGNTILSAPYVDAIWAAAASKNGAMVTVEKLVSTDYIREHPGFVQIPGYLVKSVSVVPLGGHPMWLHYEGLPGFDGYAGDYQFMDGYRKACASRESLDAWNKEWMLEIDTPDDYLRKLGPSKVASLKGGASKDAWKSELLPLIDSISTSEECTPVETMIIATARKMKELIRKQGIRLVLYGIGDAALAVWLAYYQLQNEGYSLDLMEGFGIMGCAPRPACPYFGHVSNVRTAKYLTDVNISYSVLVGGAQNKCLATIGAAQIDKHGNINASKVGPMYLVGPGGGADSVNARELMAITRQSARRFLDKVAYVTAPGDNLNTLVSDMGIFEKRGGKELILTGYIPNKKLSGPDEHIRHIKQNCGWDLQVANDVKATAPVTLDELLILRLLDPQGFFLKE